MPFTPRVVRLALVGSCGPILAVLAACSGSAGRAAAPATPLAARPAAPAPRRPKLPPGADTCDPDAYNRYAVTQLHENPEAAAAAFYWMERLSPDAPDAYYSERVALLLSDRRLLRGYIDGESRTLRSAKVLRIDSLQVRAITLNPFFPPYLDEQLIVTYWTYVIDNELRNQASAAVPVREEEVEAYVRKQLTDLSDSATQASLAYARGLWGMAAEYWADQLRRDSGDVDLRARRAKALFLSGRWDSARVELEATLRLARRSDARTMKYSYDSKVLWEYELGWINETQKRDSAARDHYQRALVEDLSFYPAHLRLAYLALHAADTVTAVTELQRAIEIKDDEFSSRLLLGVLQASRRAFEPATEQLRRATEIEPWVAYPHYVLGNVRKEAGDREGAATEYRRFLVLAARSDPNVGAARRQLDGLSPPRP